MNQQPTLGVLCGAVSMATLGVFCQSGSRARIAAPLSVGRMMAPL